jgi:hypothetical protein
VPFPPDPIPYTPELGEDTPPEGVTLYAWHRELLERAERMAWLAVPAPEGAPPTSTRVQNEAPDPWEPLPPPEPITLEPEPVTIDWNAILRRQRERRRAGGGVQRNSNRIEVESNQREEAESMPSNESGEVRLPENNYAMVVHPTSAEYCPYILIAGEWYVLEDAINMGQAGYRPTLRPAPTRDVQYFLNPSLSVSSRFEVVYHGAHHGAHHRENLLQREVF